MKPSLRHFVLVSTGSALLSSSARAELGVETSDGEPAFWQKAGAVAPVHDQHADPFGVQDGGSGWAHRDPKLAAGPAVSLRLRQVTFRVPANVEMTIQTDGEVSGNGALFQRLSEQNDRGEISVIADFDYGATGGQMADQQATQLFNYPTEMEPFAARVAAAPTAFESRGLGTGCSLLPRIRQDAVRVDVDAGRVRWGGFSSWVASPLTPVAAQPRSCVIRQPVILTEGVRGTSLCRGGIQLIAVQPEASVPGSAEGVGAWLYSFLRADPMTPATSAGASGPAAEGSGMVLEIIVIRAACGGVARWLAERGAGTDDGADFVKWERGAATGATSGPSRWLLSGATGPVGPGGPPMTTIQSIGEFIYPTEFDPGLKGEKMFCPTAFETRNCGSSFAAQATWGADGKTALVSLSFEDVALEEIQEWPTRLHEPLFRIEQPLFHDRVFTSEVAVPENSVRFVGVREARTPPGGGGADIDRGCELLFLKARGTPEIIATEARPTPQVFEAQAVVFSVPAAMAAQSAQETDESRRIAALWDGHSAGEVKVIHLSAGAASLGGTLRNADFFETIYPDEIEIETVTADFIGLSAFETFNHGAELNLRSRLVGGAADASVGLQWESAPPLRPTWDDYRRFCESKKGDVPKPRFFQEKAAESGASVSMDGQWHILSFQECSAPEGAAEHGRWHAAVVRVFQRGG